MPAEEGRNREVLSEQEAMTEHSFDALARGLASGSVSRSRALRLLGGALLGGVLASIPGIAFADHKPSHGGGGGGPTNPRGSRGCTEPKVRVGGKCVCPTPCPTPQVHNQTSCECECPANQNCTASGGTVNDSSCECVCPTGTTTCENNACCTADQVCSNGQCLEVCRSTACRTCYCGDSVTNTITTQVCIGASSCAGIQSPTCEEACPPGTSNVGAATSCTPPPGEMAVCQPTTDPGTPGTQCVHVPCAPATGA